MSISTNKSILITPGSYSSLATSVSQIDLKWYESGIGTFVFVPNSGDLRSTIYNWEQNSEPVILLGGIGTLNNQRKFVGPYQDFSGNFTGISSFPYIQFFPLSGAIYANTVSVNGIASFNQIYSIGLSTFGSINLLGNLYDQNFQSGTLGQILSSTGSGIAWTSVNTTGIITASGGTPNQVTKFLNEDTIGNSTITDTGSVVTIGVGLSVSGFNSSFGFYGPGTNLTNLNASNLASGVVSPDRVSGDYSGITSVGNLSSLNVLGLTTVAAIDLSGPVYDKNYSAGINGQILTTTVSGVAWSSINSLGIITGSIELNQVAVGGPENSITGFSTFIFNDIGLSIGTSVPENKLTVDGTINVSGVLIGSQFISTVFSPVPPMIVSSTAQVANLNAQYWGNQNYPLTTTGDLLYSSDNSGTAARLAPNTSTIIKVLTQVGNGTQASAPSWQPLPAAGFIQYFFTGFAATDAPNNFQLANDLPVGLGTTTVNVGSGEILVAKYITAPGVPNLEFLPSGNLSAYVWGSQTFGTSNIQLRVDFYETSAFGTSIAKITSSNDSTFLTSSPERFTLIGITTATYNLASRNSRIQAQVYAVHGEIGIASVNVFFGNGFDSLVQIVAPGADVTNFVPYDGAVFDVNLGTKNLQAGSIGLYTGFSTASPSQGQFVWNSSTQEVDLGLGEGFSVSIGFENALKVYNNSLDTLGIGSVVYVTGSAGNTPIVSLAQANTFQSGAILGVVSKSIPSASYGYVYTYGTIEYDTSNFNSGDKLFLSEIQSGILTNIAPLAPNYAALVGAALNSSSSGSIIVLQNSINTLNEPNRILFANNDNYPQGISTLVYVDGKVGIGTSSPTQTLHVEGDFRLSGGLYDTNNSPGTVNQILSSTGSGIAWTSVNSTGIITASNGTPNRVTKFLDEDTIGNSTITDTGSVVTIGVGLSVAGFSSSFGFYGPGTFITNLNASSLASGTVPSSVVSGSYSGITSVGNLTNLNVIGIATATGFSGDGANLTNLNASNLASGTVNSTRISGSYSGITSVGTLSQLNVSGITTLQNLELNGWLLDSNNSAGSINQILSSTGSGIAWTSVNTTGIITASGGITNRLPKFLDEDTIGNSNITDTGTVVTIGVGLSVFGFSSSFGFYGPGTNLTNLNASNLASGTVPSARVSGSYSGITSVGNLTNLNVIGIATATSFAGDGSNLTNLNASNLASGTVPSSVVSGSYSGITSVGTLSQLNVSGVITSNGFFGPGTNLTNLNASNLITGTVPSARVSGNYSGITSVGNLTQLNVTGITTLQNLELNGWLLDSNNSAGSINQILSSTGSGIAWTSVNTTGIITASGGNPNRVTKFLDEDTIGNSTITDTGSVVTIGVGVSISGFSSSFGFYGPGTNLTNLNASNLASGTVPSAVVSGSYSGITSVGNLTQLNVTGVTTSNGFFGPGSNLTNLNASNLASGTVPSSVVSGNYSGITSVGNLTQLNVTGVTTSNGFFGPGTNITNLNASNLVTGTVPSARVSGTYSGITSVGNLTQLNVTGITTLQNLELNGWLLDSNNSSGSVNQILSSTGSGIAWTSVNTTGIITASGGTPNRVTKFLDEDTISSSNITDTGTQITLGSATSVSGILTSFGFFGPGTNLTNLNASNLASGTVPSTVVSGNYTGITSVGTLSQLNVSGVTTSNGFFGPGTNLTNLNASNLASGTVPSAVVSGTYSGITSVGTLSQLNVSGVTTSNGFFGPGTNLTNLNASNLASGTVPSARISGSYSGITSVGNLTQLNVTGITTLQNLELNGWLLDANNSAGSVNQILSSTGSGIAWTSVNTTGIITASGGTPNRVTKFLDEDTIANSNITDTGAQITLGSATSVSGILTSFGFFGPGTNLTNLNASNLASGTVPSAVVSGSYSGITSVGTLTQLNVSGVTTSGGFFGPGTNLTNLNASSLASGTVPSARVSGTYSGITSVGNLTQLNVTGITTLQNLELNGWLLDVNNSSGLVGQILSSTGSGIAWSTVSATGILTGSGITNNVPKFGSPTSLTTSNITDNGIAVTVNSQLNVNGIGSFTRDITVNSITIGLGSGQLATNTVFGNLALASNSTGAVSVAIGAFALNSNTTGNQNTALGANSLRSNTTGNNNTAIGLSAMNSNTTGASNVALGQEALRYYVAVDNQTALGYQALRGNTDTTLNTGTQNIAIGFQAGLANTSGSSNTFVGYLAGTANTSGSSNSAFGRISLTANQTGNFNTALGNNTLAANISGGANIAVGFGALGSNTSGNNNVSVGSNALNSNTISGQNVALGHEALRYYDTSNQVAVGYQALRGNITSALNTGSQNVAVGYQAGLANTSGTANTFVGYAAGSANTSGSYNTAVGQNSLAANTTGTNNAATGHGTLSLNISGSQNSAFGVLALASSANGNSNTALGFAALRYYVSASSQTAVGSSALQGNVTSALNTGTQNTAIGASAGLANTSGSNNLFAGHNSGVANTTGSQNTFVGSLSGDGNTTGNSNTYLGYLTDGLSTGSYQIAIGNGVTPTGSNLGAWGGNTNATRTDLGIGTFTPLARLHVETLAAGNMGLYIAGSASQTADLMEVNATTGGTNYFTITGIGSVGILTATPTQYLDVNATTRLRGRLFDVNNSAGTQNQVLISTGTGISWTTATATGIVTGTGVATRIAYYADPNTLTSNSNFIIDSLGQFGISTTIPRQRLDVYAIARFSGQVIFYGSTSNDAIGLTQQFDSTYQGTNNVLRFRQGGSTAGAVAFSFYDFLPNIFMTLDGSNLPRVGIGTTGPLQALHVGGNALISGLTTSSGFFGPGTNLTNLNASNLASGTVPSAVVSGSYSGITSVGNLTQLNVTGVTTSNGFFGPGTNLTNLNASNLTSGTVPSSVVSGTYSGITSVGNLTQLNVTGITTLQNLELNGWLLDANNSSGLAGQILSSTGSGIAWTSVNTTGIITASGGTPNRLTKFLDEDTIGNSTITDTGTQITLGSATSVSGILTSFGFFGPGTNLTNLNASNLASGTVPSAVVSGSYSGITSVGTLSQLNVSGVTTSNGFFGPGTNLTNLNASNLASGIVPSAVISGSYSGITSVGNLTQLNVTGITTLQNLELNGWLLDVNNSSGLAGQILSSTGSGIAWSTISSTGILTGSGITNNVPKFGSPTSLTISNITDNGIAVTVNSRIFVNGIGSFTGDISVNSITVGLGSGQVATNTAVGGQAFNANTTGLEGVAIGYQAGLGNTSGNNNVAVGALALQSNTRGSGNVAIGRGALRYYSATNNQIAIGQGALAGSSSTALNTGVDNIAIGVSAGIANTAGSYNVMLGQFAMSSNTTGSNNVAIGLQALYSNTSGGSNVAIGINAMIYYAVGQQNVAIGGGALQGITTTAANTGTNNVALGYNAGTGNTSGSNNIFVGHSAGNSNTTGSRNSAFGYEALRYYVSVNEQTAIGYQALRGNSTTTLNTGAQNTALGAFAGTANTSGLRNTFVGYAAGTANTSGSDNVGVGNQALWANLTGLENVAIGNFALNSNVSGNYNVSIGQDANGYTVSGSNQVAIGWRALRGSFTTSLNTGTQNTAIGSQAGVANTSGSNNLFVGYQAGLANTSGSQNTFLGNISGDGMLTGSNNTFVGDSSDGASGSSYQIAIGRAVIPTASNLGAWGGNTNATRTDLGIGTFTPLARLHVETLTAANMGLYIAGSASQTGDLVEVNATTNGANYFTITGIGSVGIYTNTPSQAFDVNGGARLRSRLFDGNNSSGSQNQVLISTGTGISWTTATATGIVTGAGTANQVTYWNSTNQITGNNLFVYNGIGSVGIGTNSPEYALHVVGTMAATIKSFIIDHPTKSGRKLRYASLEGPENGVYVRGKSTENTILLPDYWKGLVDHETITVSLTPIGNYQKLYIEKIEDYVVYVKCNNILNKNLNYFYTVYGERKDVDKLEVEI
jgi:hypothetical protein